MDFVLQELKFTEEVLNILIPIAMKAIEGQLIDDRRFASSGSTALECCYLFRGESLQNIWGQFFPGRHWCITATTRINSKYTKYRYHSKESWRNWDGKMDQTISFSLNLPAVEVGAQENFHHPAQTSTRSYLLSTKSYLLVYWMKLSVFMSYHPIWSG